MKDLLEKIKRFPGKVWNAFKGLAKRVKILIVVALCLVLALIIWAIAAAIVNYNNRPYSVLFGELDTEDLASVVTFLDENEISDYKIENGDTVLVLAAQEDAIRASILMSGSYPSSGFSYSTYLDNVGLLTSSTDREQLSVYELQDRLGATISLLTGVKSAVVNITPQEDSRWILDTENLTEASANVVVTMRDGYEMTSGLANSIGSLIMSGVQGLSIDDVVVVDQDGKTWPMGTTEEDLSDTTSLMVSLQTQAAARIRNAILDVLVPLYGSENLGVGVNVDVDVSKSYEESVTYDYPDDSAFNDLGIHGLIGEYVWDYNMVTDGDEVTGGVVGTETNADLSEYVTNQIENGNTSEAGASGDIQYDNDQTTRQEERYGGVITDVSVSVSINSSVIQDSNLTNVEDLVALVARAAGIDAEAQEDKVAVVLRPFYVAPAEDDGTTEPLLPAWAIYALIAGVAAFLLLLVLVLLFLRRAKKRKEERLAAEAEAAEAEEKVELVIPPEEGGIPQEEGAQIMDIPADRTMELRQDVRRFTEENPEIAAQMIKSWLRGGEESA